MILEYHTTFEWAVAAAKDSDVDRLMFPNYMDFLLFVKDDTYKGLMKNAFVLTNAIKYPFQIGMAFAAENDNMTVVEERFLQCMRYELPTLERQVKIDDKKHSRKNATTCLVISLTKHYRAADGGQPAVIRVRK